MFSAPAQFSSSVCDVTRRSMRAARSSLTFPVMDWEIWGSLNELTGHACCLPLCFPLIFSFGVNQCRAKLKSSSVKPNIYGALTPPNLTRNSKTRTTSRYLSPKTVGQPVLVTVMRVGAMGLTCDQYHGHHSGFLVLCSRSASSTHE